MAKNAKTKLGGLEMPTTPFVHLGGRDVSVKKMTNKQLAIWRGMREAEREPNIWESASPCMAVPAR